MSNIVPFGKYKGQPVEVLQNDPSYVEWLMAQDGFRQRYPQIVSVIINNFGEPEETPEHNQLQLRFLEDKFRIQFAWAYRRRSRYQQPFRKNWEYVFSVATENKPPVFEANAIDCQFALGLSEFNRRRSTCQPCSDCAQKYRDYPNTYRTDVSIDEFRSNLKCHDCKEQHSFNQQWFYSGFRVEIKPSVGDDYPAILRQILSQKPSRAVSVLFFESTCSAVASEQQIRQFFECSQVACLSLAEVLAIDIEAEIEKEKQFFEQEQIRFGKP